MKAEVYIAHNNHEYHIKVHGRATFECSSSLRNLAKSLGKETFSKITVDLQECTTMDSTFMGVLAMLGLRAKKGFASMEILNADDSNKALLFGLGLHKLFSFAEYIEEDIEEWEETDNKIDAKENAETVLDAHESLMDIDEGNVQKFEKVVDMVKKDIDKMD